MMFVHAVSIVAGGTQSVFSASVKASLVLLSAYVSEFGDLTRFARQVQVRLSANAQQVLLRIQHPASIRTPYGLGPDMRSASGP